jgi:CBS domain-containing protein
MPAEEGMKASDIMTRTVITVGPNDNVKKAAELMVHHRISALPVVDGTGKPIGVVSEGDLLHRGEIKTERHRSWWLDLVTGGERMANDYVKAFGTKVKDVMTASVVSVNEATPLTELAELLETKHIKRVPVVREGKVVGIVSRANLVQALASAPQLLIPDTKPDDVAIRDRVLAELGKQRWSNPAAINVVVHNGVVHLWGTVFSAGERKALSVLAERVAGVKTVQDHTEYYAPPMLP